MSRSSKCSPPDNPKSDKKGRDKMSDLANVPYEIGKIWTESTFPQTKIGSSSILLSALPD
jgi:hypothetical protein